MPRIRSVKPQFWLDERLGSIPRDARLLYIGLWNLSDDQGVFEWRPARIRVQLFPYDNDITGDDIERWLDMLAETGDVESYQHNGQQFGYIRTFLKHQEIKKPSQWGFAPPPVSNSTPLVGGELPTSNPAVPLGSRLYGVGSRVLGSKEEEEAKNKKGREVTTETEFLEYVEETKTEFPDLDCEVEFRKFKLYWSEGSRKLKRPKYAWHNWLLKAREIARDKGVDHKTGESIGRPREDPHKYSKGKYGKFVQR